MLSLRVASLSAVAVLAVVAGGVVTNCGTSNPVTAAAECATYCSQVVQHCLTNQYDIDEGPSTCNTTCGRFPMTGKDGDTSGDTVQCRLHYSGPSASSDPADSCAAAGVSGNNVCGTWCDVYCREAMTNCTGSYAQFTSKAECETACATMPTNGQPGAQTGNNVQCRIYYMNLAAGSATDAQAANCPLGNPNSTICK